MASSPINAFWQQQQSLNNNPYKQSTMSQNYYDPNSQGSIHHQHQVIIPGQTQQQQPTSSIQLASVNPQLFLQGFRLRVCPTKPVPWDDVRKLDFNSLRLAPPDLDKMRDMTLRLIDAQFDANTIFGEVTVATKDGGYVMKPAPSVADVVSLCRSLQAVLQFNLHSISALKDQVRKQTIINQNFESELKRLTNDHVNQVSATSRAKESQITYLEDRIAKLVAESTKLRETLLTSEAKVKELRIEHSSAELAWKEERMRLQDENHALRQFIAGHGGSLMADGNSRRAVFENILSGGGTNNNLQPSSRDDQKKKSNKNHRHRSSSKCHHRSSSKSHNHRHHHRCCHKCGGGDNKIKPLPVAFVNAPMIDDPNKLATVESQPATKPNEPTKNQNQNHHTELQQQQETLLPYQAPSALEQLRMQESIDQNRKQNDENFNKLESVVRMQGDELRNSVKIVGDVAQRSMQATTEAEARQRKSTDQLSEALNKIRQTQQDSETRVLGVLNQNDQQVRDHINRVGDKLKNETREVVTEKVDALSKRVGAIEEDVAALKNAPPPPKHISVALKESTNAEYPQLPPTQQISPSRLPRQQVNDHSSSGSTSHVLQSQHHPKQEQEPQQQHQEPAGNVDMSNVQYVNHERKLYSPRRDSGAEVVEDDAKLVVLPLDKKSNNNENENNNSNNSNNNVQVSLLKIDRPTFDQQHRKDSQRPPETPFLHPPYPVTDEDLNVSNNNNYNNNVEHENINNNKPTTRRRGPDDSETLSTTDPDDSFQVRYREKRAARKEQERIEKMMMQEGEGDGHQKDGEKKLMMSNTSDDDDDDHHHQQQKEEEQVNALAAAAASQSGNILGHSNSNNHKMMMATKSFVEGNGRDPDENHLVDDGDMMNSHNHIGGGSHNINHNSNSNNIFGASSSGGAPIVAAATASGRDDTTKKDDPAAAATAGGKQEDENDLYTEDEFGDRVLKQKKDNNKRPSAVTLEDSATAHTPLKQSESSRELEKLKQQLRDLGEDY